jgi:hypothetical protein
MKNPTEAQKKKAQVSAEERIARAEARIREGNKSREEMIADCERERKKRELANDVIGALTWSLTALGLGQNQSPGKK